MQLDFARGHLVRFQFLRAVSIFAIVTVASPGQADRLDDFARGVMKDSHIPAVVVGILKGGSVVMSRAYGYSNLESRTLASKDTVFEIGSVSKQFTATVVLMLMQEGKLDLSDAVSKYVTGLPLAWQGVTLRQLLTHTSGVPDIEEIFGYGSYRNIYTTEQIIEIANSRSMDFQSGQGWKYSNTGYYLLALCLEKITGRPYGRLMKERIFDPLGMTHSGESNPTQVIPERSAGYEFQESVGWLNRDAMQPSACKGAGTLVSTLADMAKWDQAITSHRFLRPEIQEMMWTPTRLPSGTADYGFGWFISPWRGHPSVEHSGGTAGFSCDYRRFQDLGFSVMVFTNLYACNDGGIEMRTADLYSPGLSYVSYKALPDSGSVRAGLLEAMAGVARDSGRPPLITETMWKSYQPVSHRDWKDRLATMRRFELIDDQKYAARKSAYGEDVVETRVYRLVYGKGTLFIQFDLTPDGKVAFQTRVPN